MSTCTTTDRTQIGIEPGSVRQPEPRLFGDCLPFEMVNAGDHCSLRMSKQIDPLALMLRSIN